MVCSELAVSVRFHGCGFQKKLELWSRANPNGFRVSGLLYGFVQGLLAEGFRVYLEGQGT